MEPTKEELQQKIGELEAELEASRDGVDIVLRVPQAALSALASAIMHVAMDPGQFSMDTVDLDELDPDDVIDMRPNADAWGNAPSAEYRIIEEEEKP